MWILKKQNEQTKTQKWTHRDREQTSGCQREQGGRRRVKSVRVTRGTHFQG